MEAFNPCGSPFLTYHLKVENHDGGVYLKSGKESYLPCPRVRYHVPWEQITIRSATPSGAQTIEHYAYVLLNSKRT